MLRRQKFRGQVLLGRQHPENLHVHYQVRLREIVRPEANYAVLPQLKGQLEVANAGLPKISRARNPQQELK